MSVLRPRPPTDPIEHEPPRGALSDGGRPDPRWRAWLERGEEVRGAVASSCGRATEAMLEAYGTTRSPARRRDSVLFGILDHARRVRESVDRVVVIGDRADRCLVDLLLSTCCHPRHDDLPRHERGGRPRIWTLSPDDDDDTVQGIVDALAPRSGDRLLDAWGVLAAGPCHEAFTQDCLRLFAAGVEAPDRVDLAALQGSGDERCGPVPVQDEASGGVFTAAALLPAAIAGIDVVRLLEGAAAMARRFREAPAEANPVVSLAIVGRWLAQPHCRPEGSPRRSIVPPPRWRGLVEWLASRSVPPLPGAPPMLDVCFRTPIAVAECRRDPFASSPRTAPLRSPQEGVATGAADRLLLPRCDEHTVGQLLEGLRLAAAVEAALG